MNDMYIFNELIIAHVHLRSRELMDITSTVKLNKLTAVFYASVLLLIMNFVITLPKY